GRREDPPAPRAPGAARAARAASAGGASVMKCREFAEFLMEYLDGALGESERCVFEGHVGDCPACMNYLETYRGPARVGREVCAPYAELPPDVPEELVQAILAARRQH